MSEQQTSLKEEHFPNALNIPVGQIQQRMAEFEENNKPIVALLCQRSKKRLCCKVVTFSRFIRDVTNAGGLSDMPGSKNLHIIIYDLLMREVVLNGFRNVRD